MSKKEQINSRLLKKKPEEKLAFSASVSKIKTFTSCKLKYKFSYIEKLPKKEWEHLKFGNFVHEVLETFHKKLLAGDVTPRHSLMTECFKAALKNWKLEAEAKKEAYEIINKYLTLLAEQEKNDNLSHVIAVEKEFYINIDDKILLNGFIDRVQLDKDNVLHVADYKTSRSKTYLEKDFFQLLTYAFVMCLENPDLERVRASYIMLKHDFEFVTKEFTRKEIMKIEKDFLKYADKIMAETEFNAKTSPLCRFCDFLDNCPKGQSFIDSRGNQNNLTKFGASNW